MSNFRLEFSRFPECLGIVLWRFFQFRAQPEDFLQQIGLHLSVVRLAKNAPHLVGVFLMIKKLPVVIRDGGDLSLFISPSVRFVEMNQRVIGGDDAIMRAHLVVSGIFVVMVVECGAPIGGGGPFKQWKKASPLHSAGNGLAGDLQECLGDINIGDQILIHAPGFDNRRPADEKRRTRGLDRKSTRLNSSH